MDQMEKGDEVRLVHIYGDIKERVIYIIFNLFS